MKYRNNLGSTNGNAYFRVVSPFHVLVPIAHYPSNTFAGASQVFGILHRRMEVQPGDEIHDLCGGVFVLFNSRGDAKARPARIALSDRHPFEKVYAGEIEQWPTDNLIQMSLPTKKSYDTGYLPTVGHPGHTHGRGIDSVERES